MPGVQRREGQETKRTSQLTWKGASEKGGHSSTALETPQVPWKKMRENTDLQMTQLHKRQSSKGGLKMNS